MKPLFAVVAYLLLLAPVTASATSFQCAVKDYLSIHYSKTAYGKPVAHVFAHVGVVLHSWGAPQSPYWTSTTRVDLADKGDHLFGKVSLLSGYNKGTSRDAVAIQYWVYFEGGSEKPLIETYYYSDYPRSIQYNELFKSTPEQEAFDLLEDASGTKVVSVQRCHTS